MAFTSIKVRDDDKQDFDRLRHEVALHGGQDLPQHELFHRILEIALSSKQEWMQQSRTKPSQSWSRFQFDLEEPTDATHDLDRVVYGLDT